MTSWNWGPRPADTRDTGIPKKTREEVYSRDGLVCRYCGGPGDDLDHVFARKQGGSHEATNLVVCCQMCNSIAGREYFPEFHYKRLFILERRKKLGLV